MSHRALNPQQFESPPPEFGTQPIPEGALRFNHYTHPDAVPDIQAQGLLRSKSEEAYARGRTESPQVFATAGEPDHDLMYGSPVVEGWARPEQLDVGRVHPPEWTEQNRSVITFRGDVPRDQILAVHQPWHNHARYIENNPDVLKDTLSGEHDWTIDHPVEGPTVGQAVRYIKQKYGAQ